MFEWIWRKLNKNSPAQAEWEVRQARRRLARENDDREDVTTDMSFLEQVEAKEEELYGHISKKTEQTREIVERRIDEAEDRLDDDDE